MCGENNNKNENYKKEKCIKNNNKEDEDMATVSLEEKYTINEREAKCIANAPKTKVKIPSYAKKFQLSSREREKRASEVLNKWKYL
ncbi:hypothetical protein GCM10008983_18970 [Lentibacillus halophilus]|uniref:Uncharacterized protein n=1 Tax=Lentibacillus halophilus TaxID=295065 RepID=A0ABN0ZBV0_9BACI